LNLIAFEFDCLDCFSSIFAPPTAKIVPTPMSQIQNLRYFLFSSNSDGKGKPNSDNAYIRLSRVVLMVQGLGVGLVIERSLVRLPAGALSSQLGQLPGR